MPSDGVEHSRLDCSIHVIQQHGLSASNLLRLLSFRQDTQSLDETRLKVVATNTVAENQALRSVVQGTTNVVSTAMASNMSTDPSKQQITTSGWLVSKTRSTISSVRLDMAPRPPSGQLAPHLGALKWPWPADLEASSGVPGRLVEVVCEQLVIPIFLGSWIYIFFGGEESAGRS